MLGALWTVSQFLHLGRWAGGYFQRSDKKGRLREVTSLCKVTQPENGRARICSWECLYSIAHVLIASKILRNTNVT